MKLEELVFLPKRMRPRPMREMKYRYLALKAYQWHRALMRSSHRRRSLHKWIHHLQMSTWRNFRKVTSPVVFGDISTLYVGRRNDFVES